MRARLRVQTKATVRVIFMRNGPYPNLNTTPWILPLTPAPDPWLVYVLDVALTLPTLRDRLLLLVAAPIAGLSCTLIAAPIAGLSCTLIAAPIAGLSCSRCGPRSDRNMSSCRGCADVGPGRGVWVRARYQCIMSSQDMVPDVATIWACSHVHGLRCYP